MNLTSFQMELFVDDLEASIDFYGRVLSFTIGKREPNGYTPMHNGSAHISLNDRTKIPSHHPARIAQGERPGRGVEFVFWVEDIRKLYAEVQKQEWPIAEPLKRRPWGSEDFCLQDPDGYFLRFASRVLVDEKKEEK